MSDDLVKRLRNTPNWVREEYGGYKDGVKQYDRSPFEAADRIEELAAINEELEAKAVELANLVEEFSDIALWKVAKPLVWPILYPKGEK